MQARLIQPDTYCRRKGRGASRVSSRQQIAARSARAQESLEARTGAVCVAMHGNTLVDRDSS